MNYNVLSSIEFWKTYESSLNAGEFKFITKAYLPSENTVAIFPSENKVDCYFQLPSAKTTLVPFLRRFVYKLNKNSIIESRFLTKGDGRIVIPVVDLEIWADPYEEVDNEIEELIVTHKEETVETMVEKIDDIIFNITTELNKLKKIKDEIKY